MNTALIILGFVQMLFALAMIYCALTPEEKGFRGFFWQLATLSGGMGVLCLTGIIHA